ncbi:winged helix-turn-helix transcriptional regulator [Haloarcula sp. CBA1127]|uniref:winged helix-turn-helix transcriptional regulator n=1 Tax=Haloarcula sp. CBA1127 TaxID=1765055 RepID=UPI00073F3D02|nr:winged helix-turn-helix transcriptional regulator [Haloarcula sp. CBA1127]
MSDELDHLSFEATGSRAVETVMSVLEQFADGSQFDRVYVEIGNPSKSDRPKVQQTSLPFDGENQESGQEPKSIQSGTSHHKMLSALKQLENQAPVATRRTLEIVDLPKGTAYAAMSALYDRGLVNRTDKKNDDNSYEYEISEAGDAELERLGTIE